MVCLTRGYWTDVGDINVAWIFLVRIIHAWFRVFGFQFVPWDLLPIRFVSIVALILLAVFPTMVGLGIIVPRLTRSVMIWWDVGILITGEHILHFLFRGRKVVVKMRSGLKLKISYIWAVIPSLLKQLGLFILPEGLLPRVKASLELAERVCASAGIFWSRLWGLILDGICYLLLVEFVRNVLLIRRRLDWILSNPILWDFKRSVNFQLWFEQKFSALDCFPLNLVLGLPHDSLDSWRTLELYCCEPHESLCFVVESKHSLVDHAKLRKIRLKFL